MDRPIVAGGIHDYSIHLRAGDFAKIVVREKNIDVVIELSSPAGRSICSVDDPSEPPNEETAFVIAETSGTYAFYVTAFDGWVRRGVYQIRLEGPRTPTEDDRRRFTAQQFLRRGAELRQDVREGSLEESIGEYRKSLVLSRELKDRPLEAHTSTELGQLHFILGDYQKSLEYHREAFELYHSLGELRGQAFSLNYIGRAHSSLGEVRKSIDYYLRTLPLRRAMRDRAGEAIAYQNVGAAHSNLGHLQKALDSYSHALNLLVGARERRITLASHRSHSLKSIGDIYNLRSAHAKAIRYYQQALETLRAMDLPNDKAELLARIGSIHSLWGHRETALDYYQRAIAYSQARIGRRWEVHIADVLMKIGLLYYATREDKKAEDYFRQALERRRAWADLPGEIQSMFQIATAYRGRGELLAARERMEGAMILLDTLRLRISRLDLRVSYSGLIQSYNEAYIELLVRLHRKFPLEGYDGLALQVNERARARNLIESLSGIGVDIRQGIDPALLQRERELQRRLNEKAHYQWRLLGGKHTPEQAASVARELDDLNGEFQQVVAAIRQNSPHRSTLRHPQALTLSEIRRDVLDPDTLLLEYALGKDKSFLWAVTTTSISIFELPGREHLEPLAQQFYQMLTARRRVPGESVVRWQQRVAEAELKYPALARSLSRVLLGPVAGQLESKRLLVVPDGALQYIPFGALTLPSASIDRSPGTHCRPGAFYCPLIAQNEIVMLPSASTLAVLRQEESRRKPGERLLAMFADPVFDPEDPRVNGMANGKKLLRTVSAGSSKFNQKITDLERAVREIGLAKTQHRLPRLPFARREAAWIEPLLAEGKYRIALDFEASREAVKDPEIGRHQIVHFATHALVNFVHPELSGIVLSLVDRDGRSLDGFLRLNEIYNLELGADLVVLSACQTALGKEVRGEGLVGLTRGFMQAGAARVIASLWTIPDRTTAELMKHFYRGFLGAQRPGAASALRAAQLEIWKQKQWRSPYYWAGFVLQGDW